MISCIILSNEKVFFEGKISSISLQSFNGEIQILPDHVDAFILFPATEVRLIKENGSQEKLNLETGLCHFSNNNLKIII